MARVGWATLALAGAPCSVVAQGADLTRATCADFARLGRSDRDQLAVWLHGYYAGAAQRPMIEPSRLEQAKQRLEQTCGQSPATALIGADLRGIFLGDPGAPPASATPRPGSAAPAPQPASPPP